MRPTFVFIHTYTRTYTYIYIYIYIYIQVYVRRYVYTFSDVQYAGLCTYVQLLAQRHKAAIGSCQKNGPLHRQVQRLQQKELEASSPFGYLLFLAVPRSRLWFNADTLLVCLFECTPRPPKGFDLLRNSRKHGYHRGLRCPGAEPGKSLATQRTGGN